MKLGKVYKKVAKDMCIKVKTKMFSDNFTIILDALTVNVIVRDGKWPKFKIIPNASSVNEVQWVLLKTDMMLFTDLFIAASSKYGNITEPGIIEIKNYNLHDVYIKPFEEYVMLCGFIPTGYDDDHCDYCYDYIFDFSGEKNISGWFEEEFANELYIWIADNLESFEKLKVEMLDGIPKGKAFYSDCVYEPDDIKAAVLYHYSMGNFTVKVLADATMISESTIYKWINEHIKEEGPDVISGLLIYRKLANTIFIDKKHHKAIFGK